MVGPSLTDDERDVANARLKIGFVLLVAASAALMAMQADPSLLEVAAAFVGGAILGAALLWFVLRNLAGFRPPARR